MGPGQVLGGALRVRAAHKPTNPEGLPQGFWGEGEPIPTACRKTVGAMVPIARLNAEPSMFKLSIG